MSAHEDWRDRWRTKRIGFHQDHPSPHLVQHLPKIRAASRVLVPLCGKSLDLALLADAGHEVVGVELVEEAVLAFFEEAKLQPERSETDVGVRYELGRISLWVSDFFALGSELGTFDFIFDRAALIALPESLRGRYAARELELLRPGGTMLLVAVDYDPRQMNGPPYAVSETEIRSIYPTTVDKGRVTDALEPRFRDRGVTALSETTYLISKL